MHLFETNKNAEQVAVANPLGAFPVKVFTQLQPQPLRSPSLSPMD